MRARRRVLFGVIGGLLLAVVAMSLLKALVARRVLQLSSGSSSGDGGDVAYAKIIGTTTIVGGGAPGVWQPLGQLNAITVAEGDAYLVCWSGQIHWDIGSGEEFEIAFRTMQPGASEFSFLTESGSHIEAAAGSGTQYVSISGVVVAGAAGELPIQLAARNDSANAQAIWSIGALYAIKVDLS